MNYKAKLQKISTFIFDYDGVMTDGTVYPSADGDLMRAANVKDGYALQFAVKHGYRVVVISGGQSESMSQRLKTLEVKDVFLGVSNKIACYEAYCTQHQLQDEEVIYMGDDIPDYELLQRVGVSCCPADAAEEILEIVDYISHQKGGKGAVRDIIRQVMKLHGHWMNKSAFEW